MVNSACFMVFAVFDPSPITVCINCSFNIYWYRDQLECGQMPKVMTAEQNTSAGGVVCESSVIPFLVPRRKGAQQLLAPNFRPMSIVAKWSPISATAELLQKFSDL